MRDLGLNRVLLNVFLILAVLASAAGGVEITEIQRGVHSDFELFVVYCDSLPSVGAAYDRVLNVLSVSLGGARLSPSAAEAMAHFPAGVSLSRLESPASGKLDFHIIGTAAVTIYLVSGPPAVIIDLCRREEGGGALPYELDRDGYLQQGGQAERRGDFDLALRYLGRVRETAGDEPALTHRAGVIQQKLGRWELALESLGRTREVAEFAADAHARRSMIYLTMGDTSTSGQEWAAYFHRPEVMKSGMPPAPAAAPNYRPASHSASERPNYNFKPRFLPVIEAGDGNYFYVGGGLLLVGVIALISVLTGGAGGRQYELAARDELYDLPYPRRSRFRPATTKVRSSSEIPPPAPAAEPIVSPPLSPRTETVVSPAVEKPPLSAPPRKISPRVVQSYTNPVPETARPTSNPQRKVIPSSSSSVSPSSASSSPSPGEAHRLLVDRIVTQARSGVADPEIARQMGISRDEVRMILNLARLAEREQS